MISRSLLFSSIVLIFAGATQAAVTEWHFIKAIGGEQLAADTAPPLEFPELLVRVITEDAGEATTATLSGGPGSTRNFTQDGRVWWLVLEFDDEAELDAAFPSETTYTISLSGGSLGTLTQEVVLGPKAYPETTPYFEGSTYADMESGSVDPGSDFTVAFNPAGTSANLTFFLAEADFSGGSAEDDWLVSGDGSMTSFLIPSGTLLADKPYFGMLFFGQGQTVSGDGGLGAEGTVSHAVFVEAPLETASAALTDISGFRVDSIEVNGNDIVLKAETGTGWIYQLQRSGNLGANEWVKEGVPTEGDSTLKTWIHTVEEPFEEQFYRILATGTGSGSATEGFSLIPAGTFTIGSPEGELGRARDRETQHQVTLTKEFYVGQTEVTWTVWAEVRGWAVANGYDDLSTGRNGLDGDASGNHPATEVSWWDSIKWCNARSEMDGLTPVYYTSASFGSGNILRSGTSTPYADWSANGYRLPTEAEWEYACRAGTTTALYTGGIIDTDPSIVDTNLGAVGWYVANSRENTHVVGGRQANAWDLYDMHGNVLEWCWDWFQDDLGSGIATDPIGPSSGFERVLRGGSWQSQAEECRSAFRTRNSPSIAINSIGFRVARNSNP